MLTLSEENYLKEIYHLAKNDNKEISTNAIAKKLQTRASSVTDMVKKLADKKMLLYKKYQGVRFTEIGKKEAKSIIRKHRLWEVFLVEKLHFSWDEVHDVAEQLEHIQSEKLINELDAFLGFPKRDPHGDLIPDASGNVQEHQQVLLSSLAKNESGICVGVKDSSSEFLQYLDKQKIALGQQITIVEKESFDGSVQLKIEDNVFTVSQKLAANLYIQKL